MKANEKQDENPIENKLLKIMTKKSDCDNFSIGQLVKSIAGRDKLRFYLVIKIEKDFVYISDGKIHKIENPKRKNIKHLSKTNKYLDMTEQIELTNKKLRQSLNCLNNN